MKKFLNNKKVLTTFIIIILILSTLSLSTRLRNEKSTPFFLQRLGNDTVALLTRVVNAPLQLVGQGSANVEDLLNTQAENDHLKKQIKDLGQTKARISALEDENKQLKRSLKLKATLTDYDLVTAAVISRAPDTWSELLTIDKGSRAGIAKDMPVMSGGGVIGRIVEVDATTAKVELITSTDKAANRFAVEAESASGNKVHGIISVVGNGSELAFTQVVDSERLKKGTEVYTSGLGGLSPRGLLIGRVTQTTRDSFGLSDVIKIKSAGNLNNPAVVTVVERKVIK